MQNLIVLLDVLEVALAVNLRVQKAVEESDFLQVLVPFLLSTSYEFELAVDDLVFRLPLELQGLGECADY